MQGDLFSTLEASDERVHSEAAAAILREFRETTRLQRLVCREALPLPDAPHILRLAVGPDLGGIRDLEGARVVRPHDLEQFNLHDASTLAWSGEIVEADDVAGHLYVVSDVPEAERADLLGPLFCEPFPFLHPLRKAFHDEQFAWLKPTLAARLRLSANLDSVSPETRLTGADSGRVLDDLWSRAWSIAWGPPGTGKTHTLGEEVAYRIANSQDRILVVSTTNRASDGAALAIGRALRKNHPAILAGDAVTRIGKGADRSRFEREDLCEILEDSDSEARRALARMTHELRFAVRAAHRAQIRARMRATMRKIGNFLARAALDEQRQVLVTTVHSGLFLASTKNILKPDEDPPFDQVVVDEAGQVSRAAAALVSTLGNRTMFVGDSRQLAPISTIARVIAPSKARWLDASPLSHLVSTRPSPGVVLLDRQWRMHPAIRHVVSEYQYEGRLRDAPAIEARAHAAGRSPIGDSRIAWYVLDDDVKQFADLRAERGAGQRSWIRRATLDVLEKLLRHMPGLAKQRVMFITPFVAQAQMVDRWMVDRSLETWTSSTVHSQQGAETDVVIFDTVNASAHIWPVAEWKRLINVAISRAREAVLLIASRSEMREPYLAPLESHFEPRILRRLSRGFEWIEVPGCENPHEKITAHEADSDERAEASPIGRQIASRRTMTSVLSREQERLSRMALDGKPRLVRGVAGSGKTMILANWLAQAAFHLTDVEGARIWVVYCNKSLRALIEDATEEAWRRRTGKSGFPWERVTLWHLQRLLAHLYERHELGRADFGFDYDAGAQRVLEARQEDDEGLCHALFVDEAQDVGDTALKLLARLVMPSDDENAKSRNFIVFYDNAQNIYGRRTPKWSDFGLEMRGRSTVLKESFRSTHPISELALNVLHRLEDRDDDPDHRELLRRRLVETRRRNGRPWLAVCYNEIGGPRPSFRRFAQRHEELDWLGDRLVRLIDDQGVSPSDIRILTVGRPVMMDVERTVSERLAHLGAEALIQTSETFVRAPNVVVITTPHSFKGYDSEVVFVVAVDRFQARARGILAHGLYVAMTRARSILELSGSVVDGGRNDADAQRILETIETATRDSETTDDQGSHPFAASDMENVLERLGRRHATWLRKLSERHELRTSPIRDASGGAVLPLFWWNDANQRSACLDPVTSTDRDRLTLESLDIKIVEPPSPGTSPQPFTETR